MKKRIKIILIVLICLLFLSIIFASLVIRNTSDILPPPKQPENSEIKEFETEENKKEPIDINTDDKSKYVEYVINEELPVINNNDNTNNTEKDEDINNEFTVDWNFLKEINIFSNYYFDGENKIAPGVSDSYLFKIVNGRDNKIKFDISFQEENTDNINMKYRLKQNNKYIIGSDNKWYTTNDLIIKDQVIEANKTSEYTLEWKWIDSENDTEIGKKDTVTYSLAISVCGEDINK